MKKGCCDDAGHVTNRRDKQMGVDIGEGLFNVRTWIKELAFEKRIRNFKVLCLLMLLEWDSEDLVEAAMRIKSYWSADPVHMTNDGYKFLTISLLEAVAGTTFTRSNGGSTEKQPEAGGQIATRGRKQVHPPPPHAKRELGLHRRENSRASR
jgi:hypothetical protein